MVNNRLILPLLSLLLFFSFDTWASGKFHKSWVRSTIDVRHKNESSFHHMTPVFYGNLVIQGNGTDGITAYHSHSGSRVWKKKILGGVEGGAVVHGDQIYFSGNDGFFYCLRVTDGKVLWKFTTGAEGLSAPVVIGDRVYFQSAARIVYALDRKTGKKKWIYARKDPSSFSIRGASSPSVSGQTLVVGFSDGYLVALNRRTGAVLWEKQLRVRGRFRDIDMKPIIDDQFVYIGGFEGSFYKLRLKTGSVIWKKKLPVYVSPLVVSGKLYVSTQDGRVLSLDKKTGETLWSQKLIIKGGALTSPVLFNSDLLVGASQKGLLLLNQKNGQIKAGFDNGRGLVAKPGVKKGSVFFISTSGNLFSLKWVENSSKVRWLSY